MRYATILALMAITVGLHLGAAENGGAEAEAEAEGAAASEGLKTPEQRIAYLYGNGPLADHLRQFADRYDTDIATVLRGLQDALTGAPSLVPASEQEQLLELLEAKRAKREAAAAGENLEKGRAYLAQAKEREDAVALPSGLVYEVLVEGDGPQPQASDTVKVHYRGTLIDGKEFDSSYSRGQPATFPVGGVIPGWTEGLQLMKVGGKWRFHIPPDLAYGEEAPPSIGPNQVLVFEVELLDILPQQQQGGNPAGQ